MGLAPVIFRRKPLWCMLLSAIEFFQRTLRAFLLDMFEYLEFHVRGVVLNNIGGCVKKVLLACCLGAIFMMGMSTLALADGGGLYLSAKGGIGFMRGDKTMSHNQTSLDNDKTSWSSDTFSYGAAVGWNWFDTGAPVRTEIEYYDHGKVKMTHNDDNGTASASSAVQTLQLNVYYDFYNDTNFVPYLGLGAGVANVKNTGGKSSTNFAYSLIAGTGYKFTESLLLDIGYKISQFGEGATFTYSDADNSYDGKIKNMYSIEGTIGLRYQF